MTLTHAYPVGGPTLTVTDLSVSFTDPDSGLVEVLGPLRFAAGPGQFVCLVGRSGSGKTSVLRQLLRLSVPAAGTVSWDGQDIAGMRVDESADLRRTNEPTCSLDRRWADDVTAALREHADRGGLVAAASHDPGLAAAADLTIRLDEG